MDQCSSHMIRNDVVVHWMLEEGRGRYNFNRRAIVDVGHVKSRCSYTRESYAALISKRAIVGHELNAQSLLVEDA